MNKKIKNVINVMQVILNLKFIVSPRNCQCLPLLHQSGVSALSIHRRYDAAVVRQVDCIVF